MTVAEDDYLADLPARIEALTEGWPVEVLRIRKARGNAAASLTAEARETLDELSPHDVFARRLLQEPVVRNVQVYAGEAAPFTFVGMVRHSFLRNEADVPGMRRAGSLAWGGLANCYYWADPASGVAGMLCGQFLPFADPGMLAAFEAFERAVYAE